MDSTKYTVKAFSPKTYFFLRTFLVYIVLTVCQSAPAHQWQAGLAQTSLVKQKTGAAYLSKLDELQESWTVWKTQHRKTYGSHDEELQRFAVWMENNDYIEEHNRNGKKYGYTLGMNHFGDQTFDEWSDFHICHKQYSGEYNDQYVSAFKHGLLDAKLREEHLDWRDRGVVTDVKNQEDYRCHSCYAFASVGALEGAHAIAARELVSLSEQELLDCSKVYGNAACQKGNYISSWEYIIKNGGIDTSSYYPYKSVGGFCDFSPDYIGAKMSSIRVIESGNEDALVEAVQVEGPVTVAIDHLRRPFQFYREGVYSDTSCNTNPMNATHEMVVVGYGNDDYSGAYWILKNSYGTTWGDNGYMLMFRGTNTCGIASDAGFPVI